MLLAAALARHQPADDEEAADLDRFRAFVARQPDAFDRRLLEAHLTGCAVILSAEGERVLLLHHRKLECWLQPGGHASRGETTGESVALREAREETGVSGLALHPSAPRPLDVDIYPIPAWKTEPAHEHFDLRYLVTAPREASLARSKAESNDVRWFGWDELAALDLDRGLRRALAKARAYVLPTS
jgi:8-oxo-dGTP pyrophosphatase MutT (NUDIX family)